MSETDRARDVYARVNRRVAVSGAQPPEVLADTLAQAETAT